jgi:membrane carboxypeptidase/penicillin-binding protein
MNSATLRLADAVGLDRVLAMASKLGFGNLPPYPSVVLGGIEVEPMRLAAMYAILANEGMEVQPYAVTAVVSANGQVIEGHELRAEQVLTPEVAYSMDFMLEQVIKHGTGIGVRKAGFLRPAAGKTGTTNDSVDAWFAGFTPNLLAVVWTGFDQKEALGLTGAEASLPAWADFMKAATAARPDIDFPMPSDVVRVRVDPLTGYLASRHCPVTMEGVFPKALAPVKVCPFHTSAARVASGATSDAAADDGNDSYLESGDSPND